MKTSMECLRVIICLTIFSIASFVKAQAPQDLVNSFFKSMYENDTIGLKKCLIQNPSFHTSGVNREGIRNINIGDYKGFLKTIVAHKKGELDERISNVRINNLGDVATVSMDYSFYYKGKFSHCGINVFHLLKDNNGWKITGIDDTNQKTECSQAIIEKVSLFIDEWHMDATRADSLAYFTKLDDNSMFIGTDSSEVWNKAQFAKFAGPFFAKGKAWDFKKLSRNLHYEASKNIVWFDEMLTTWMGPCRGSGFVAIDDDGNFKIVQYVLSVTVPNDKINRVIEAIKAK